MSNLKIDRIFSFAHHSLSLFPSYPFPYHSLILRHLKSIYRIHHHQTCKIMDTLIACEHFQCIKLNLVNTHSDIFSHRQILWNLTYTLSLIWSIRLTCHWWKIYLKCIFILFIHAIKNYYVHSNQWQTPLSNINHVRLGWSCTHLSLFPCVH